MGSDMRQDRVPRPRIADVVALLVSLIWAIRSVDVAIDLARNNRPEWGIAALLAVTFFAATIWVWRRSTWWHAVALAAVTLAATGCLELIAEGQSWQINIPGALALVWIVLDWIFRPGCHELDGGEIGNARNSHW